MTCFVPPKSPEGVPAAALPPPESRYLIRLTPTRDRARVSPGDGSPKEVPGYSGKDAGMTESFLEKLKKSVLHGAHTSATKIEEAARTGKLHLDLMAERRKLAREFTELGREAHLALLEDGIA